MKWGMLDHFDQTPRMAIDSELANHFSQSAEIEASHFGKSGR
jgi:hypothetical protein